MGNPCGTISLNGFVCAIEITAVDLAIKIYFLLKHNSGACYMESQVFSSQLPASKTIHCNPFWAFCTTKIKFLLR